MKTGIELIAEERRHQIFGEGYTQQHDDSHTDQSLALAASCYAIPSEKRQMYTSTATPDKIKDFVPHPHYWPNSWDASWWKPTPDDRVRELVKAGALIVAEIERIQRLVM